MSLLLKRRSVSYEEVEATAQTGDIVLMHGDFMISRLTEFLEGSTWSHSAMLVRPNDIGLESEDNSLLLWESNIDSPVKDVILDKSKTGPMLVNFRERMQVNYQHKDDSKFAIRSLYIDRTEEMFNHLNMTIKSVHNATFPDPLMNEMVNFKMGRYDGKKSEDGTFFCSQLLSHTLMNMGLLTTIHPDNSYAPADFSEDLDVTLKQRAFLGKEQIIDIETILNS